MNRFIIFIGGALALCFLMTSNTHQAMGAMVLPRLPVSVLLSRDDWPLVDDRIVGGTTAGEFEFPYQISLQRIGLFGTWSHSCGGSIYNATTILNAAHCVDQAATSSLRVVAGEYSLSSVSGYEQTRSVSSYRKHPNYNSATSVNDIALITLSSALSFNNRVSAITLPSKTPDAGSFCTVSGWGTTIEGGSTIPAILQKVNLPIVSTSKCQQSYGSSAITKDMICAGYDLGGFDSCQGDSGGPLVLQGTNTQVGIVSWGYGCANPYYYGVYANVYHFRNWIQGINSGFSVHLVTAVSLPYFLIYLVVFLTLN